MTNAVKCKDVEHRARKKYVAARECQEHGAGVDCYLCVSLSIGGAVVHAVP